MVGAPAVKLRALGHGSPSISYWMFQQHIDSIHNSNRLIQMTLETADDIATFAGKWHTLWHWLCGETMCGINSAIANTRDTPITLEKQSKYIHPQKPVKMKQTTLSIYKSEAHQQLLNLAAQEAYTIPGVSNKGHPPDLNQQHVQLQHFVYINHGSNNRDHYIHNHHRRRRWRPATLSELWQPPAH